MAITLKCGCKVLDDGSFKVGKDARHQDAGNAISWLSFTRLGPEGFK